MRIKSRFELLPDIRRALIDWARQVGVSAEAIQDLVLCVHEAAMNAIEHGNKLDPEREVSIEMLDVGHQVAITIRDEGGGIRAEPGGARDEDPPPTSGRGLPTIFALMDEVAINRARGEITLKLSKDR